MVRHSKCSVTAGYYNGGVWLLTVLDHLRIVTPSSGFQGEPVWVNVGTTGVDEAWAILPNLRGMNLLILLFICRLCWVTDVWGGVGWWLEWEMPALGSCIGELHPQLKALSGKLTELSEDGVLLQEVCCWVQASKIYSFACFCSLSVLVYGWKCERPASCSNHHASLSVAMLFPPWWTLALRLRKLKQTLLSSKLLLVRAFYQSNREVTSTDGNWRLLPDQVPVISLSPAPASRLFGTCLGFKGARPFPSAC